MKDFIALEDEAPIEPSHNKLTTQLGRLIDNVAYWQVALGACSIIFLSAIYFYAASGGANGLDKCGGKTFAESLYFSIITFSTVGYGDLAPVGWGRLIATIEVLTGVLLTSLFIGKIASERQAALLLLIYTSDQQRRITKFAGEMRGFTETLGFSAVPTIGSVNSAATQVRSLRAYLIFQSHQGRLADFGNGSALHNLYRAMYELQMEIAQTLTRMTMLEPTVEDGLVKVAERIDRLAELMKQFHPKEKGTITRLNSIREWTREIKIWETTSVTTRRQEQVRAVVPRKPWPKHFHKAAADDLGISRNVFRQCMDALIKSGRIKC